MVEQFDLINLCILIVCYYGRIKFRSGCLVRAYRQNARTIAQPTVAIYHYLLEFNYQFY